MLVKAPIDTVLDWNDRDIVGQQRWIQKLWRICCSYLETHNRTELPKEMDNRYNTIDLREFVRSTIRDVTQSFTDFAFHNAISFLIKLCNRLATIPSSHPHMRECLDVLSRLLFPMAPHIASEIQHLLNPEHEPVSLSQQLTWPAPDPIFQSSTSNELTSVIVQINGKAKTKVLLSSLALDNVSDTQFESLVLEKLSLDFPLLIPPSQIESSIIGKRKAINFLISK